MSLDHHLYSTTTLPLPPLLHPATAADDHLCYVHCTRCDTSLAVSVPTTSLFKTVTVRCGCCSYLLPVTMYGLTLPPPPAVNQFHFGQSFLISPSPTTQDDQIANGSSNFLMNKSFPNDDDDVSVTAKGFNDLPKPQHINRPPEKRQRIPSAYNKFIKEEIHRIKARNPNISHREAFSAAAKNWAHFPHIHFGLVGDKTSAAVKKASMRQQDIEGGFMKEALFSPYYY